MTNFLVPFARKDKIFLWPQGLFYQIEQTLHSRGCVRLSGEGGTGWVEKFLIFLDHYASALAQENCLVVVH
jgi:hypothetical protein